MTRIANAPLIEVIFELRWGLAKKDPGGLHLNFSEEETKFFPGQFKSLAGISGYTHMETINKPPLPHLVNYRFRKAANSWPCLQIGTGIFTVNQVNEGYDWDNFQPAIMDGVTILEKSLPKSLKSITPVHMEIRYRDGFVLGDNESPSQFLQTRLNFGLEDPPPKFLDSQFLGKRVFGHSISFRVETTTPSGAFIFVLNEAIINGRNGFIIDNIVRSEPDKVSHASISKWLDQAHDIERHAFSTLINIKRTEDFE